MRGWGLGDETNSNQCTGHTVQTHKDLLRSSRQRGEFCKATVQFCVPGICMNGGTCIEEAICAMFVYVSCLNMECGICKVIMSTRTDNYWSGKKESESANLCRWLHMHKCPCPSVLQGWC